MTATYAVRVGADAGRKLLRSMLMWFTLPILLIAAWWILSANSTNVFFPPLEQIVGEIGPTWFEGRIQTDVLPSVARLLSGYTIALVVGISAGLALGGNRAVHAFTEPVLEFIRSIPPTAMIPVLILFLGFGENMRLTVIAMGAVWPILLNTVQGVRGVDEVLADTARVYQLGFWRRVRTLYLRGASPMIVTGARQSLSIAIILMVISEMFAAHSGLGHSIVQFQRSFALPEMWGGIIVLGVLGVILSMGFRVAEHYTLRWYHGLRGTQRGGN